MKYRGIIFAWLAVLIISGFIKEAGGWQFFAGNSLWSLLLIFVILEIDRGKLALSICSIECAAILVNLLACHGYLSYTNSIYTHYAVIIDAINLFEGILLLLGAFGNGIINRVQSLWRSVGDRNSTSDWATKGSVDLHGAEECR